MFRFFLAWNAACHFRACLQPGRRNADAAIRAFAVSACFNARQCGVKSDKFIDFTLADGELQLALSGHLRARIFAAFKMVGSGLRAAQHAAALHIICSSSVARWVSSCWR